MRNTEVELLMKYIDKSNEDVRRTIGVAFAHSDGRIDELNKTIKEHNGRLTEVECEQHKQKKVIGVIKWIGKHWYIAAVVLVAIIFILIPLVELLGIKGILSLIK
jgi:phage shock protein PspC (stress-responsive transcriptional regulator)